MEYLIRGGDYLARQPGFCLRGRDDDLQRLTSVLMRDRASSVVLVGAGGVGCTALCLGMQVAKNAIDAPFDLVNKRLYWLDTNGLFGTDPDKTSHAFHKILGRLYNVRSAVLIIENTRDFLDACRNSGQTHFINALLAMVRAHHIQVLFEAKDDDLDQVLRCHSDVRELFTVLPLDEPSGEALQEIVTETAQAVAKHHGIRISPDAIIASIELTNKYQSRDGGLSRAQPERSVTLLDRALASYRLSVHRHPPGYTDAEWERLRGQLRQLQRNQRDGEIEITRLEDELEVLEQKDKANGESVLSGFSPPAVTDIRQHIKIYQAEIDKNRKQFQDLTGEINAKLELAREQVLSEFSEISGIPASKLDQDEIEKLRHLEAALAARIFGQDGVLRRVSNGVKVARVGRRTNRPLSYLFLGPSGVGKSELSKVLAAALLDDEAALTRFDMSEYMEKHAVAKMIGAPPGYEGFEAGGILTNLMRRNPNRVLLFDEIEKAHPDIFNIMLQVLEDGRLTDNIGRTVSFSDSVIIMTTNIGQPHFLNPALSPDDAEARAIDDLGQTYRAEFLNRFAGRQNILCFKPLGLESIERIVSREIGALNRVYSDRGVQIEIELPTIREFCADQYDPKIGARGLPGFISTNLEPAIVNAVLETGGDFIARIGYDKRVQRFDVLIIPVR